MTDIRNAAKNFDQAILHSHVEERNNNDPLKDYFWSEKTNRRCNSCYDPVTIHYLYSNAKRSTRKCGSIYSNTALALQDPYKNTIKLVIDANVCHKI